MSRYPKNHTPRCRYAIAVLRKGRYEVHWSERLTDLVAMLEVGESCLAAKFERGQEMHLTRTERGFFQRPRRRP